MHEANVNCEKVLLANKKESQSDIDVYLFWQVYIIGNIIWDTNV